MSNLVVIHPESSYDGLEKRRAIRHLCNRVCYARANGTHSGAAWGVTIWDISTTGIRLSLHIQLEPGIVLALQPAGITGANVLYAKIVRVEFRNNSWFYGCEFLKPIDEFELQFWLHE